MPPSPADWFSSSDWPLAPAPNPADWPSFPFETGSESGMRYFLDTDRFNERCGYRSPTAYVSCMMPRDHDSLHLPQSEEIIHRIGPMIVRSFWRSYAPVS